MKVNKIKKSGSKYKIFLDDMIIDTYDEVILKYNLLYKKSLDDKLIDIINMENNYYESYHKALNFIGKRLRSEKEVLDYLSKCECKDSESIITKLKSIGLINDENFAKAYINDKINLTLDGPDKIKSNLRKLGVNESIINNFLDNIDNSIFEGHLKKLIEKKVKNTKYTGNVLKTKLNIYLTGLGYNTYMIKNILDNLVITNNLTHEMDKIYNKLKLKYSDKELKNKLKQKLYSKGFSVEEINDFIESKNL